MLASIEEQGKLTDELRSQILAAETMVLVEDLYRPYKPKRRTRATIAKEKGLEPLAGIITLQMLNTPLAAEAEKFLDAEKGVETVEDAIAGAKDIIAEGISDEADYRSHIRELTVKKGRIVSIAKDPEAESVYEMYYDFNEGEFRSRCDKLSIPLDKNIKNFSTGMRAKLRMEIPHSRYPTQMKIFRLPTRSLRAPMRMVVRVATTAEAATIRLIFLVIFILPSVIATTKQTGSITVCQVR